MGEFMNKIKLNCTVTRYQLEGYWRRMRVCVCSVHCASWTGYALFVGSMFELESDFYYVLVRFIHAILNISWFHWSIVCAENKMCTKFSACICTCSENDIISKFIVVIWSLYGENLYLPYTDDRPIYKIEFAVCYNTCIYVYIFFRALPAIACTLCTRETIFSEHTFNWMDVDIVRIGDRLFCIVCAFVLILSEALPSQH